MPSHFSNAMLAFALVLPTMKPKQVNPMAMPQRNLFYEGAKMPVTPRFAEKLLSGQARIEMDAFSNARRRWQQTLRFYEFNA